MKKTTTTTVALLVSIVICSAAGTLVQARLGIKLAAKERVERQSAYRQALADKKQLVQDLLNILNKKAYTPDEDDPHSLAVKLLGEMRSVEAIPWLIANIDFFPPKDEFEIPPLSDLYPCVSALTKIGKPASLAAVEGLKTEQDVQRVKLLCLTVEKIEGKEVAVFMMKNAVGSVREEKSKQFLTKAVGILEASN